MTTQLLNNYFRHIWKPNTDKYTYSGWALVNKVNPTDSILDVGCGYNQFKQYFGDRLLGIDPYNSAADIEISIEDFNPNAANFDVIFCLGSVNFGNEQTILRQIEKIVSWCKPGGMIYWRQNPGRKDHGNIECQEIDFFDWSYDKNIKYSDKFGCRIEALIMDDNRIYAEWRKR